MFYWKSRPHGEIIVTGPQKALKFRAIPKHSELIRKVFWISFHANSLKVNPIQFEWIQTKFLKLIRLNTRHQFKWIRTNPNEVFNPNSDWSKPNFKSESIRMNPRPEWFGLILIENSQKSIFKKPIFSVFYLNSVSNFPWKWGWKIWNKGKFFRIFILIEISSRNFRLLSKKQ